MKQKFQIGDKCLYNIYVCEIEGIGIKIKNPSHLYYHIIIKNVVGSMRKCINDDDGGCVRSDKLLKYNKINLNIIKKKLYC